MRKIVETYYVCQYCGFKDTDENNLKLHEKVCKTKRDLSEMIGTWLVIDDSTFFKIMDVKPLTGTVQGIRITPFDISTCTYQVKDLINKSEDRKFQHIVAWGKWKRAIE